MAGQTLTNVIKLLKDTGATPAAFESVGNVVDINGPQFTNERIEVTDGDSPSNSKEYLAARQDPGPIQLTLNYDFENERHRQIVSGMQTAPPTITAYRTQYNDDAANYLTGSAFTASFALSGNSRGQALTAAVSLQPTSVWTLNP
jgi:hypothetical protein